MFVLPLSNLTRRLWNFLTPNGNLNFLASMMGVHGDFLSFLKLFGTRLSFHVQYEGLPLLNYCSYQLRSRPGSQILFLILLNKKS